MKASRIRRQVILASTFLVAALATLSAPAADALNGTWQLNVAKSSYSPGPTPRSIVRTYTVTADGVRTVADTVNAAGVATHTDYTCKFDGMDYSLGATAPGQPDTAAWRRIDGHHYEMTLKMRGQMLTTAKKVVSRDGKTLTDTVTGTNSDGKVVNNVLVWNRL
jgi:hypothetical protein